MLLYGHVIIFNESNSKEEASFVGMDSDGSYYVSITQPLIYKTEQEANEALQEIKDKNLLKNHDPEKFEVTNLWID